MIGTIMIEGKMNRVSIKRVLEEAANLIEHGWLQNRAYNEDNTAFCVLGAIEYAARSENIVVMDAAELYLKEYLGLENASVISWNDAPHRTRREVVQALRGTARGLLE